MTFRITICVRALDLAIIRFSHNIFILLDSTVVRSRIGKMLIQDLVLVLICVEVVSSTIITPPGLQRKNRGESCTFQWTVQGSFTNYSVYNKSTGALTPVSASATHTRDVAQGLISLTIRNVQLWDAGNYSLSINVGTSSTTDNGALLFVYGDSQSVLSQTNGSSPATEGSHVEFTCTVTPSSLPISHRPKLYYFWRVGTTHFQNISSGPAKLPSGDLLPGYSIKNGGKTLVIDAVQYRDQQIACWGQEEGTPNVCCNGTHQIQLYYRPHVLSRTPPNRRFHSEVGKQVRLGLNVSTYPSIISSAWNFVSMSGVPTPLPPADVQNYQSLVFGLPSQTYYGNYSITLVNNVGSTTETFQVLPPAVSEIPTHLQVVYAIHRQILLQWNCMWFNGYVQTISVLLEETTSRTEIETRNTTVDNSCYNSSQTTLFQSKIRPETNYVASIWSSNSLGSSDITKLAVSTPKRFKLVVSSRTITFNGTEANIHFSQLNGNMTYLTVTCCPESTGSCLSKSYIITIASYPLVFNGLPDDDAYLFDFTAFGGQSRYFLTMVKGIRVSRTGDDDDDCSTTPFLIAISVLAVLLVVALLALVGSLLFFLIKRKQHRQDPPKLPNIEEKTKRERELPKRPLPQKKPARPVTQKPPPPDDDDDNGDDDAQETYEIADAPDKDDDRFYMPLNEKPTRAMRNQYS